MGEVLAQRMWKTRMCEDDQEVDGLALEGGEGGLTPAGRQMERRRRKLKRMRSGTQGGSPAGPGPRDYWKTMSHGQGQKQQAGPCMVVGG